MVPLHFGKTSQKGYVLLLSVLVISAISVSVTVTLFLLSIGSSRNSLVVQQSEQAVAYADACAEEALEKLSRSNTYAGNEMLVFDHGTCEIRTILGSGDTNRTIEVEGVVSGVTKRFSLFVSSRTSEMVVESWQEVSGF